MTSSDMTFWNYITVYVAGAELLSSLFTVSTNASKKTEFIEQMIALGGKIKVKYPELLSYPNEAPNLSTMTFTREADNLEIGWATSSSPSVEFFAGLCMKADAEEIVYTWTEEGTQASKKLAFSGNSFIKIS
jgi:hypothetical protein